MATFHIQIPVARSGLPSCQFSAVWYTFRSEEEVHAEARRAEAEDLRWMFRRDRVLILLTSLTKPRLSL